MKRLGFVLLGIFLLSAIGCKAEPPKTGVVDVIKVVNGTTVGQKANAEVEALVKAKQAMLKEQEETIKKLEKDLKEHPNKAKEEELKRASNGFQKLLAGSDAEVKKKTAELRRKVLEQLKKVVDTIGQEEKFLVILTTEQVAYYDKTTDITDKVIKKFEELAGGK